MIKGLDKRNDTIPIKHESKEGEQTLLSSNKGSIGSPSLDFLDTSSDEVSEDMIIDYLASIISAIYLKKRYGYTKTNESSNLLPGINKRTG